uniref:Protein kinase domain-containing protein n=1 Tax=Trichogramma kaykai TaxID=54128 RepID=A0ABD2X1X4_9HYME
MNDVDNKQCDQILPATPQKQPTKCKSIRDLKMENVMLFDKRKELIKIVDFGLSNIYNDKNPMRTQCGSPEYAAPELFVKNYKYGPEVDLWSLNKFVQSKLNNIVTEKFTRKAKTSNDLEVKTDNTTKNEVNKAFNKTIPLKIQPCANTTRVFIRRKNKITKYIDKVKKRIF